VNATAAEHTEVLVVGGGPAGAAAAYWLARDGHAVTVIERRVFPRSKACGDIVTPRAVQQLIDMGLGAELDRWHRLGSIELRNHERALTLRWPSHPHQPTAALVARRRDVDEMVLAHAAAAGATVHHGHEAIEPLVDRGFVRGALVRSPNGSTRAISARYVVVADGANSSFGRALGTFRTRGWPFAAAIRSYWRSPRHDEHHLEISIDLVDRSDHALPGYGWVAPVGDGTVNVGVGLLSTARDFKGINVAHLLDGFVDDIADRWGLEPEATAGVVRVGRIPMGGSVNPTAGPTFVVTGDAAAMASPFIGAGIDAAYESGRLAATVMHDALGEAGPTALQRYPRLLAEAFGDQYKLGRLGCRALGRPMLMRQLAGATIRSAALSDGLLRVMTGALRPHDHGAAETSVRLANALTRMAPDA
jgi:geranylgeranyl reductase family protein